VKWAVFGFFGAICLVLVDRWAGLGFIWPETSEKPPIRPQIGPNRHPSVWLGADRWPASNVVDIRGQW
jgi:hypothetical protein